MVKGFSRNSKKHKFDSHSQKKNKKKKSKIYYLYNKYEVCKVHGKIKNYYTIPSSCVHVQCTMYYLD